MKRVTLVIFESRVFLLMVSDYQTTTSEASLNTKQEELQMQVQQLTQECERLKEEKSQRQALTLQLQALQLQQLQLENEKFKNQEFKFNRLVAAAYSLKSKVEQFCNECERCDPEDASQSDSSWELCTLMTEGSGISIDTAGHCFMREAVFKASEAFCLGSETGAYRPLCSNMFHLEWIRIFQTLLKHGTNSLIELLQLQLHVYDVLTKLPGFDAVHCKM